MFGHDILRTDLMHLFTNLAFFPHVSVITMFRTHTSRGFYTSIEDSEIVLMLLASQILYMFAKHNSCLLYSQFYN